MAKIAVLKTSSKERQRGIEQGEYSFEADLPMPDLFRY
jgi:hypothetical protein